MMTSWYAERSPDGSARAVIAMTLLALLLVAAVPVALLAAVVMMAIGHVVGGLALFGGSVLAAALAAALAGMSGIRHLRKLLLRSGFRVAPLDGNQYADLAEPQSNGYTDVVRLDRSEYTPGAFRAAGLPVPGHPAQRNVYQLTGRQGLPWSPGIDAHIRRRGGELLGHGRLILVDIDIPAAVDGAPMV